MPRSELQDDVALIKFRTSSTHTSFHKFLAAEAASRRQRLWGSTPKRDWAPPVLVDVTPPPLPKLLVLLPPPPPPPPEPSPPAAPPPLTLRSLLRVVAEIADLEIYQIACDVRTRPLVRVRWAYAYLARHLTRHGSQSLNAIGAALGGRDHTTILYSIRKVTAVRCRDHELNGLIIKTCEALGVPDPGV